MRIENCDNCDMQIENLGVFFVEKKIKRKKIVDFLIIIIFDDDVFIAL